MMFYLKFRFIVIYDFSKSYGFAECSTSTWNKMQIVKLFEQNFMKLLEKLTVY